MLPKVFQPISSLLLDFFFPSACCSCQKLGTYLCNNCYNAVQFFTLPIRLKLEPLFLDGLLAATQYRPPITSLIHLMKYSSVKDIAQFCGEMMYYTVNLPPTDLLTAVPLHHTRQSRRGFNQAEEVARTLSAFTSIPYLPLLQRTKNQAHQASITHRQKRLTNLRDAFELNPQSTTKLPSLQSKTILLIDDVATTGTTLNECAKVLKEAGAAKVYGLVIAHGS